MTPAKWLRLLRCVNPSKESEDGYTTRAVISASSYAQEYKRCGGVE